MKRTLLLSLAVMAGFLCAGPSLMAAQVRVKDIARVQAYRLHSMVGYGIVTGLAGTGDSANNRATRQSLSNLLSQFNLNVSPEAITSRNVAAVMVAAQLPAFAKAGDAVDVTVTSMGDARSLVGGNLLLSPLKGPDGRVYALAQGPLTVGGYKYDANGNITQKNHPTAATVPGGATVEIEPPQATDTDQALTQFSISLMEADYTTASRLADAINRELDTPAAKPVDAQAVMVKVPREYAGRLVDFIRRVEQLEITPDQRARVVINERTGTVVAGAEVSIAPVAISFGDLKISVVTDNAVSQPTVIGNSSPTIGSVTYANSRVEVQEPTGSVHVTQRGGTVSDLVRALSRLKTNTRDIVSILKALKSAGALHAELVVQ